MRIGILGGTFDPVHNAHLFVAEDVGARLALDRILLMPNGAPPHKKAYAVSPPEHRLRMVELAVAGSQLLAADDYEVRAPWPSYTVNTLREMRCRYPRAEIVFITGVDAVADIGSWRDPDEVLRLCRMVAVSRPGYTASDLQRIVPRHLLDNIEMLQTPEISISSTEIRRRVAMGLPIRYLTPDAVVAYIREHNLYRS